jgi:ribulose-5-phosphate 4-epimerase/fuculose-1-phosphate aldolase
MPYTTGLDYGANSVRCLVVNATDGRELGTAVYEQWSLYKIIQALQTASRWIRCIRKHNQHGRCHERLVANHGPFTWRPNPAKAVESAVVLEQVAEMALKTAIIEPKLSAISQTLLDKHYLRKHGKNAYYGQNKSEKK